MTALKAWNPGSMKMWLKRFTTVRQTYRIASRKPRKGAATEMNEILEAIRSRVGEENLCDSCEESGCKASLEDVPLSRVLVDANRAFEAHQIAGNRCDCILFFMNSDEGSFFAVPIELKNGNVDASEVFAQLQQGANFADRFAPRSRNSICRPILIHGPGIHKSQQKKLNRAKIRFRGADCTIERGRCDRPRNLANALPM